MSYRRNSGKKQPSIQGANLGAKSKSATKPGKFGGKTSNKARFGLLGQRVRNQWHTKGRGSGSEKRQSGVSTDPASFIFLFPQNAPPDRRISNGITKCWAAVIEYLQPVTPRKDRDISISPHA